MEKLENIKVDSYAPFDDILTAIKAKDMSTEDVRKLIDSYFKQNCEAEIKENNKKIETIKDKISSHFKQIKSYEAEIADYNKKNTLYNEGLKNILDGLQKIKIASDKSVYGVGLFKLKEDLGGIEYKATKEELEAYTKSLKMKTLACSGIFKDIKTKLTRIRSSSEALVFAKTVTDVFLSDDEYLLKSPQGFVSSKKVIEMAIRKSCIYVPFNNGQYSYSKLILDSIKIITGKDYSGCLKITNKDREHIKQDLAGKF